MKILFLTNSLPHSQKTTNRLRQFNWLKYLGKKHQIILVSFIDSLSEKALCGEIEQYCYRIETVVRKPHSGLMARCLNLFHDAPYLIGEQFKSEEMRQKVNILLQQENFDLIHVYSLAMAHYVMNYEKVPKILDAGDCLERNYLQQWRISSGLRNRALSFIDWTKMKHYEPKMFTMFNQCVLVSPVDKEFMLSRHPELRIQVVSIGVDLNYFRPGFSEERPPSLIFTGTMDYVPNDDAIVCFLRNTFSYIKKEFPSIKVYILGKNYSVRLKKIAMRNKNIVLTGFVKDIRPCMSGATVFICPLRMGTGIKTKVLEAMALAKPIVVSSIGAEGINVVSGRDVVLADKPHEFASCVIKLLKDKALSKKLGENARKIVENGHHWEYLAAQMEKVYHAAAQKVK